MKERPQLQLDVPIAFLPQLDRPSLAAERLRGQLLKREREEHRGKKEAGDAANEAALADPAEHFRLLVAQYRSDLGKSAQLPAPALAIEAARSRKDMPSFEPAISGLEAALIEHIEVPDLELEALGRKRVRAIQDVLLSDGDIDASRVFVINAPAKSDAGDKVRLEMSLK